MPAYNQWGPTIATWLFRAHRRSYEFSLDPPPGARSVDLTFAVRKTRTVDFLADPRES